MRQIEERIDPVDRGYAAAARQRRRYFLIALYLLGVCIYWGIFAEVPQDFREDDDHFMYGSIGADADGGIPVEIWNILPEMFPQHLPDPEAFFALKEADRTGLNGYRQFGFIVEDNAPSKVNRPIGFSLRRDLVWRTGLNCAVCHVGTVVTDGTRDIYEGGQARYAAASVYAAKANADTESGEAARSAPQPKRQIVLGMPGNTVDLQGYFQFLFKCVSDARFTTNDVMAFVNARADLGLLDRILYRFAVPELRSVLLARRQQLSYFHEIPAFGPGRVDTFGPYKTMVFKFPYDGTVGTADFPSIWNQGPREGMQLHWDGNNTSVFERNISASLGAQATPVSLDMPRMLRVTRWIGSDPPDRAPPKTAGLGEWQRPFDGDASSVKELAAPRYPFPIDLALAQSGRAHYENKCASCHGFNEEYVGKPVDIAELKTDPERLNSYTKELSLNQNTLGGGRWWRFENFRKTNGYSSMPLDGVWARAPYLHNGSVPTMRHLLYPDERPAEFYRGDDRYDTKHLGFESHIGAEARPKSADGRQLFHLKTSERGNGSEGHTYGADDLNDKQKTELIEYLKTL